MKKKNSVIEITAIRIFGKKSPTRKDMSSCFFVTSYY